MSRHGLFGPGSLSWRIDREVVVLGGGSCALLMQIAHPAVAAAVAQHSTFREDPFGRLRRTLSSSFDVIFGTAGQAQRSIDRVNAIHRSVHGTIPETGEAYSALEPRALLWVHATLVDTALRVYDRFVSPLSAAEAEAYYRECRPVARAFGVPEEAIPTSLSAVRAWMRDVIASGEVRVTPTARGPGTLDPLPQPGTTAFHVGRGASRLGLHPPCRAAPPVRSAVERCGESEGSTGRRRSPAGCCHSCRGHCVMCRRLAARTGASPYDFTFPCRRYHAAAHVARSLIWVSGRRASEDP